MVARDSLNLLVGIRATTGATLTALAAPVTCSMNADGVSTGVRTTGEALILIVGAEDCATRGGSFIGRTGEMDRVDLVVAGGAILLRSGGGDSFEDRDRRADD